VAQSGLSENLTTGRREFRAMSPPIYDCRGVLSGHRPVLHVSHSTISHQPAMNSQRRDILAQGSLPSQIRCKPSLVRTMPPKTSFA